MVSAVIGRDYAFEFLAEDPEDARAKAIVRLCTERRPGERIVEDRLLVEVPFRDNDGWSKRV